MPVPKATIGATVAGVEMLASPVAKSSSPLVFSISEISTDTPLTIRMTPHGIR